MKAFRSALATAALGCALAAPLAQAQYQGPDSSQSRYTESTVQHVLDSAKDEQKFSLKGNIVEKLGDEKYRFRDSTGEIMLEIDDDDLPSFSFDHTTPLEIRGEADTHWRKPTDIEVDSIHLL